MDHPSGEAFDFNLDAEDAETRRTLTIKLDTLRKYVKFNTYVRKQDDTQDIYYRAKMIHCKEEMFEPYFKSKELKNKVKKI